MTNVGTTGEKNRAQHPNDATCCSQPQYVYTYVETRGASAFFFRPTLWRLVVATTGDFIWPREGRSTAFVVMAAATAGRL
jgi:hypothetical protein